MNSLTTQNSHILLEMHLKSTKAQQDNSAILFTQIVDYPDKMNNPEWWKPEIQYPVHQRDVIVWCHGTWT